jgi:hypothetical protein
MYRPPFRRQKDDDILRFPIFRLGNANFVQVENKFERTPLDELGDASDYFIQEAARNFEAPRFLRNILHFT